MNLDNTLDHSLNHRLDHTLDTSLDRRDAVLAKVGNNHRAWADNAIAKIKELPVGWTGTGEGIREHVATLPHHPNAWGALVNRALKEELIYPTGDYVPMSTKSSNGRKTPVYERM